MAGAEYLQSIFGTEKDKVNCPFYFKIGACRHGEKCERRHNRPPSSQTLLIVNMYRNPALIQPDYDPKKGQEEFEEFYEDIHGELSSYGEIDELNVCDNVCDHLAGNVYVKYEREESAEKALKALSGRFYGGRPIVAEFSPVTDFRESSCRQFEMDQCNRGGHCNFMHLKKVNRDLEKKLFPNADRSSRNRRDDRRRRSRSRERYDYRDGRDSRDQRDRRDYRNSREDRDYRSSRDGGRDYRDRDSRDSREYRDDRSRDSRDYRDSRDSREYRDDRRRQRSRSPERDDKRRRQEGSENRDRHSSYSGQSEQGVPPPYQQSSPSGQQGGYGGPNDYPPPPGDHSYPPPQYQQSPPSGQQSGYSGSNDYPPPHQQHSHDSSSYPPPY